MEEEVVIDTWQLSLKKEKTALESCQKERHLTSCMMCENLLECEIRDNYIKAVYESMSKGQGGGFEF